MALSGLAGVKALFDTQPEDYCACVPTGTSNTFACGSYGSSGGMGCQPWGCFDGLPAALRRSVSGRLFFDTPLPLAQTPVENPCKPGPCHVAAPTKELGPSPTSVLGMALEAESVGDDCLLATAGQSLAQD